MGHDNVLLFLAIVVAIAILIQSLAMLGMWLSLRKIPGKVDQIRADVRLHLDPMARSVTELLTITRGPLQTVTANLADISETLRQRSAQVDTVVEDLVEKSHQQIIRADQLMSSLVDKVEATTEKVQQSILTPLHEISAVVKGLQTGLEFLFNRKRPAGGRETTQDEQLFI